MLEHGGTDLGPAVRWDFSTNANALGPPPDVVQALQRVDRRAYPEPSYAALREALGTHLGVSSDRICPTAGNAEGIRRLSLAARLSGVDEVWLPRPGYGEYEAAAQALGLRTRAYADLDGLAVALRPLHGTGAGGVLIWMCEPCNPTGAQAGEATWQALQKALLALPQVHLAVDRAYEPLRLHGPDPVPSALARSAWQLWSPNKAMSLTGVRAGVMVAPALGTGSSNSMDMATVCQLAPSWVLSSEGQALLHAWAHAQTQAALHQQRQTLSAWLAEQAGMLHSLGWTVLPSCVPFHLARLPVSDPTGPGLTAALATLRQHGIKLRDATSLGLPGWVRLRAMPPEAQQALAQVWRQHLSPQRDAA